MSESMSSGVFFVSADSKRERRPLNQSESNKRRKHGDLSGIFTVDFFWTRVRNDFSFSSSGLNHCTAKWLIYHRPISLTQLVCQGQGHYCPSLSNKTTWRYSEHFSSNRVCGLIRLIATDGPEHGLHPLYGTDHIFKCDSKSYDIWSPSFIRYPPMDKCFESCFPC